MATNSYTITSTDGTRTITILGGSFNGNTVGASGQDTDLLLYGRGSFNWGAGIEQNLIRLTENWASPAENPSAAVNAQYPAAYAANTNTGIQNPMAGQTWFNKSNGRLYVNIDGNNNSGSWRVDAESRYLNLSTGGDVTGDVRVQGTSPDLYLHTTANNFSSNAHLTFEGTDAANNRLRSALIFSDHQNDALRFRLYDKNDGITLHSEIAIRENFTSISQPIRMFVDMFDTSPDDTLTRKDYVDNAIAGADFVSTGVDGGTMTGNLTISKQSPVINLSGTLPQVGQPTLNFGDSEGNKFSIRMLQGSVSSNMLADGPVTLPANTDTVVFEKYNSEPNTINGIALFDTHIETHKTAGKIRTPETDITNDHDRTVVTLKSLKDSFRQKNDNVTIDGVSSEAELILRSPVGNLITLDAEQGATTDSRIDFETEGSLRGKIALNENYPAGNEDRLVMQKWVGSTLKSSLEVADDGIYNSRKIVVTDQDSGAGSLIFQANTDVANTTSLVNGSLANTATINDSDVSGIIFRNASGDHVGSLLSDNDARIELTSGNVNASDFGSISLRGDTCLVFSRMSAQGSGIPSLTKTLSFINNDYATEGQLEMRTDKFYQSQRVTSSRTYNANSGSWLGGPNSGSATLSTIFDFSGTFNGHFGKTTGTVKINMSFSWYAIASNPNTNTTLTEFVVGYRTGPAANLSSASWTYQTGYNTIIESDVTFPSGDAFIEIVVDINAGDSIEFELNNMGNLFDSNRYSQVIIPGYLKTAQLI